MKGRPCSICALPEAAEIAALLRSGRSARSVALELGLSDDAVGRHARNHVTHRPRPTDRPAEAAAMPLKSNEYFTMADQMLFSRIRALWPDEPPDEILRMALEVTEDLLRILERERAAVRRRMAEIALANAGPRE